MTNLKKLSNESTFLPANYQALECVSWFITDAQNVQNWTATIFRGGIDTSDPKIIDLLTASNKSIAETETDIAKLKEYLANILPTTKNVDK